jgi:hypothetical protein
MARFAHSDLPRDTTRSRLGSLMTAGRAVALAAGLLLAGITGALAQDATPATSPAAVECVAPATPATAPAAASPAASPTDETAEGTPADEATAADVIAAVENFTACFNSGDIETALSLATPAFIMETFGTDDLAMIESYFSMAPPQTEILSIGNVLTYEDGRVSVDAECMTGEHQYTRIRTFLVQAGDTYLIDGEDYLPGLPEGNVSIVSYTIPDDTASLAFDQSTSAAATDVLNLYGANNGAQPHTVILLRLPDEAVGTPVAEITPDMLMGEAPIGAVTIDPGERAELILIDLPVGHYLLMDPVVPGSGQALEITEPATE